MIGALVVGLIQIIAFDQDPNYALVVFVAAFILFYAG